MNETLGAQLHRVGLFPALAVTLAAALASFAILQQIIPISPNTAAPKIVTPVGPAARSPVPEAPAADTSAAGSPALDPIRSQNLRGVSAIQAKTAAAARHTHRTSAIPAPVVSVVTVLPGRGGAAKTTRGCPSTNAKSTGGTSPSCH
jgi:hypothetical protein